MAFNLFQNILNNMNPQAKAQFAGAGQEIKKAVEPISPIVKSIGDSGANMKGKISSGMQAIGSKFPQPTATTPMKQGFSLIPQANASQPLVSDAEIKEMIDAGATDEEIELMINEIEKERGQKAPIQQEAPDTRSIPQKTGDFLQGVWEGTSNVVGGAVAEVPSILGNTAKIVSKAGQYAPGNIIGTGIKAGFSDKTYGQLREEQKAEADKFAEYGKKGTEFVQKYGAYNKDSTGAKVGKTIADIGATIIGPGKIFKTAEGANIAIRALAGVANATVEGTTSAVSNYVATEGRLPTAKEVAEYVAITGGLKAGGKIFEQVKKLPSARLIPTTITEAGRDIRKGLDIGEAISTTGISFSKKQLISKIEKKSRLLSGKVDDAINKAIEKTGPNNVTLPSLTKLLKDEIMQDATMKAQLKGTPIQMKQIEETIDETISEYNKLYKSKKFDLNAQQQLKKDIYTGLENVFNKNFQTTGKITAQQATERQIARKLKTNIEEKVPEVIELNKQLAPFLEAGKRLNAKGGYSGYLTDILAGGFASGNPLGIMQDPVGYAQNFLLGVVAKRAGTSTLAKTSASTITANLEKLFKNPTFKKAVLDQYRQLNSNQ